ncbi:MAG TPA: DUF3579 domain-containing protein [Burkholderiales bacterium]|jgi:hypothetical protein|nr:DUF3579 domain-containing protein [Burkholderiales bacterium]
MNDTPEKLIIAGTTTTGKAFRPSDWAERLCGVMSVFGCDQQIRYSQYVRPIMMDGVRCVVLEGKLALLEPRAYRFMLDFAQDNELKIIDPAKPNQDEEYCRLPGAPV